MLHHNLCDKSHAWQALHHLLPLRARKPWEPGPVSEQAMEKTSAQIAPASAAVKGLEYCKKAKSGLCNSEAFLSRPSKESKNLIKMGNGLS